MSAASDRCSTACALADAGIAFLPPPDDDDAAAAPPEAEARGEAEPGSSILSAANTFAKSVVAATSLGSPDGRTVSSTSPRSTAATSEASSGASASAWRGPSSVVAIHRPSSQNSTTASRISRGWSRSMWSWRSSCRRLRSGCECAWSARMRTWWKASLSFPAVQKHGR